MLCFPNCDLFRCDIPKKTQSLLRWGATRKSMHSQKFELMQLKTEDAILQGMIVELLRLTSDPTTDSIQVPDWLSKLIVWSAASVAGESKLVTSFFANVGAILECKDKVFTFDLQFGTIKHQIIH